MKSALSLGSILLLWNIESAVAALRGRAPSSGFQALGMIAIGWGLAAWFLEDRRARKLPNSIDYGWFAFWAWPVVIPYYLFQTRGWRAFLILGKAVLLFLATWVVGVLVFLTLR